MKLKLYKIKLLNCFSRFFSRFYPFWKLLAAFRELFFSKADRPVNFCYLGGGGWLMTAVGFRRCCSRRFGRASGGTRSSKLAGKARSRHLSRARWPASVPERLARLDCPEKRVLNLEGWVGSYRLTGLSFRSLRPERTCWAHTFTAVPARHCCVHLRL